ncbi:hypothetical protein GCM10009733_110940 [Nonomuraea maheshkhaliensis]|uniref:STAS domain-containing protein n=1 Tax=Nonomuraea maheshkhaliensis TaxID=419590 RepID=A0ABN2I3D7_9ACTN
MPTDPATDDFSIRTRNRGDILLIHLEGTLAGPPVDIVRMYVNSTFITHPSPKVVVDIGGVRLMNEAGRQMLRSAVHRARDAGGRMIIVRGEGVLLDDSGIGLDLAPTLQDAYQALNGSGEAPDG